ncbi:MAG: PPK2 family polyphosphate kinase [Pseudomonadota bacterium]
MKALKRFRAPARVRLRDADAAPPPDQNKAVEQEQAAELIRQIALMQEMLYATRQHKVLLILQGMDTAGKDGTIDALFSTVSPMGLRAVGFKQPSEAELAHDYLWRVHGQVPAKGEIVIFNRSHYEDVLVTRVHGLVDAKECKRRYAQIRDFERMLVETGTVIVKLFLHISKEEQRRRLQARLDDPLKQWKFHPGDLAERKLWADYQDVYERAIGETDCDAAPWYIVPADSKTHRNLAVASILHATLRALKLRFPPAEPGLSAQKII